MYRFIRKNQVILIALVVNIFYLTICFLFEKKNYFGSIDDYFMARTLEGVFGEGRNVHLTFVNVLYGYFLLPFYYVFPKIGWYYIGEIAEVFISFTIVSVILIKKMGSYWGTVFSLLFVLFFARDFYTTAQFTLCASILGGAGMLLLTQTINIERFSITMYIGAGFLVLFAIFMRVDALLMGVPFFVCALLVQMKKSFQKKWVLIFFLSVMFVVFYGVEQFNHEHYASPEYRKYVSFQAPRVALGDKINYDKEFVCDELEEENFSCENLKLLNNWIFYDTKFFSIDTLQHVAKKIHKYSYAIEWFAMPRSILNWLDRSVTKPGFWAFFVFCLILMLSRGGKSCYVWGSLFVMLSLMSYLLYMQRIVYRVEAGLWLYATALSIPFIGKLPPLSKGMFKVIVFVIVFATLTIFVCCGSYIRSVNNGRLVDGSRQIELLGPRYKGLLDYIDSSSDNNVFFADMISYMSISQYKGAPYLSESLGSWKKIAPLGFWTPYFPDIEKNLHDVGIFNPIRDIVKDNVFVINESHLVDFLQVHYYDRVKVDTIKEFGNIKILKYSEVNLSHKEKND